MSALTDVTAEARAEARRASHDKAHSLMQTQGIDLTHALLKVWFDPENAELAKLAREPKPERKPRATSEELAKRIDKLEVMVSDLSADLAIKAGGLFRVVAPGAGGGRGEPGCAQREHRAAGIYRGAARYAAQGGGKLPRFGGQS